MSANITKYELSPESDKKFSAAVTLTILFTVSASISGGICIFNAMKQSGNFNGVSIYFGILVSYLVGCIIAGSGICVCVLASFYNYLRRVDEECVNVTSNDIVTHDDIALTVYSSPIYDVYPPLTTQLASPLQTTPSYSYTAQSTSQFPMLTPVYIPRYPYTTTT